MWFQVYLRNVENLGVFRLNFVFQSEGTLCCLFSLLPSSKRHFLPYFVPVTFHLIQAAIVSTLTVQDPMHLESSW